MYGKDGLYANRDAIYENASLVRIIKYTMSENYDKTAGFVLYDNDQFNLISILWVHPDHRRLGLGKWMVDAVNLKNLQTGSTLSRIEVAEDAIPFWTRIGYVKYRKTTYEKRMDTSKIYANGSIDVATSDNECAFADLMKKFPFQWIKLCSNVQYAKLMPREIEREIVEKLTCYTDKRKLTFSTLSWAKLIMIETMLASMGYCILKKCKLYYI